jgi:hypothetical protein
MIDPNLSDWSDQDLLTVTEAHQRLVDEIGVIQREIAESQAASGPGDAAQQVAGLRRRLALLEKRLRQ